MIVISWELRTDGGDLVGHWPSKPAKIRLDKQKITVHSPPDEWSGYGHKLVKVTKPEPKHDDGPPQFVTMAQAKIALSEAGYIVTVEAAIAAMTEPAKTRAEIAWNDSATMSRNGAFVTLLAPAIGLTDVQVDDLFKAAAAIQL